MLLLFYLYLIINNYEANFYSFIPIIKPVIKNLDASILFFYVNILISRTKYFYIQILINNIFDGLNFNKYYFMIDPI